MVKHFEEFTNKEFNELIKREKTYIHKKLKTHIEYTDEYNDLLILLSNFDISNFIYNKYPYGIYIKPCKKFLSLIKLINSFIINPVSLKIDFSFSISENNLIDFTEGIPKDLRGFGLGYKLYNLVIKNELFISTNKYSSKDAYNIWYHLMQDETLYCLTSKSKSVVINKNISNYDLKIILNNINTKMIMDNTLNKKIIELYGTMDNYTQR